METHTLVQHLLGPVTIAFLFHPSNDERFVSDHIANLHKHKDSSLYLRKRFEKRSVYKKTRSVFLSL